LLDSTLVAKINEDTKNVTGIDLLDKAKKLSIQEIEKYESYLDKLLLNSLSQKLPNLFLADEIELLSISRIFPLHSFRGFDINVQSMSVLIKDVLNPLGIMTPSIVPLLKSAIKVESIDSSQEVFLALSPINIKSKKALALFHLSLGDHALHTGKPSNISKTFNKSITENVDNILLDVIGVHSCFLISSSNPLLEEDSLVHLFMQGIIKYGRNTTIGNQTRKFFLKGFSSSLLINKGEDIEVDDKFSKNMRGHMGIRQTATGHEYMFVYNIAVDSMVHDYKRGIFLS
jgi:hypothetical protein